MVHANILQEFYPHPEYRASRSYNDIALVELEKRLLNEPDVNPICVRSDTEDLSSDVVLTAEGFGIIDVDSEYEECVCSTPRKLITPFHFQNKCVRRR